MSPIDARPWTRALIGLGSNLGDRRESIEKAVGMVSENADVEWKKLSRVRETVPVGGPPQGPYLNAAGEIVTRLDPWGLQRLCQDVERRLGRERRVRDGPRTIDLDLLVHGDRILDTPELTIPHPRLVERGFVLEPLAEIVPSWVHPLTGKTFLEHWRGFCATADPAHRESVDRRSPI